MVQIRKLGEHECPPIELLLNADPSLSLVEAYLQEGQCYVAEKDDEVIGVYVLLETQSDVVEIMNVSVEEEYQGKGLGKQLIQHAIVVSKETNYHSIEIGTGNSSIGQLALYQKCGFRIMEVNFDFFSRQYDEPIFENGIHCRDMIRLRREL